MEMFIYNMILVCSVIDVVIVFVVFGFYKFIWLGIELSYVYIVLNINLDELWKKV